MYDIGVWCNEYERITCTTLITYVALDADASRRRAAGDYSLTRAVASWRLEIRSRVRSRYDIVSPSLNCFYSRYEARRASGPNRHLDSPPRTFYTKRHTYACTHNHTRIQKKKKKKAKRVYVLYTYKPVSWKKNDSSRERHLIIVKWRVFFFKVPVCSKDYDVSREF